MKFKTYVFGFSGVAAAAILSSSALADTAAQAMAHVYVNVDPNVSVQALSANLGLNNGSSVQTGAFGGTVDFMVDANQEAVLLGVAATDLYKGDNPNDESVLPLPVDTTVGALIAPDAANPIQGGSNLARFGDTSFQLPTQYGDMNAYRTNDIQFESSQNGTFSQHVAVTVGWQQPDPQKPVGEYSGYVVLYTALVGAAAQPGG